MTTTLRQLRGYTTIPTISSLGCDAISTQHHDADKQPRAKLMLQPHRMLQQLWCHSHLVCLYNGDFPLATLAILVILQLRFHITSACVHHTCITTTKHQITTHTATAATSTLQELVMLRPGLGLKAKFGGLDLSSKGLG